MTSAWKKYKESLGDTKPWDIFNPNAPRASEEEAEDRLNICLECPELIKATTQCKKCLCFMNLKTKLKGATCPLSKW